MPEEPVEEAAASHEGPRSENWGQPPSEVGDLQAERVEERSMDSEDKSLRKMTKRVMRVPTP
jgi:hypothetical protein